MTAVHFDFVVSIFFMKSKFVSSFRFSIATDLVGEDLGYLQNWLQELTDECNDETRCACDGELVL